VASFLWLLSLSGTKKVTRAEKSFVSRQKGKEISKGKSSKNRLTSRQKGQRIGKDKKEQELILIKIKEQRNLTTFANII